MKQENLKMHFLDVICEGKILTPDLGGSSKTMEMAHEIGNKLIIS